MASRIQASTILTYPLGGPLLRREHGVNPPRAGEAVCNAWASGLEKTTLVRAPRTILSFAIDKLTGAFLMACDCRPSNPSNPSSLHVRIPQTPPNEEFPLFGIDMPIVTSVNVSPSRFVIATCGDDDRSFISITRLMNKDRFMDCYHHNPGATIPRDSRWRLFFETRNQPFVTAAKPDLTSATFVAGSNRCLVVIREREGGWDASLRRLNSVRNITSVDWLDHNTYLTGERSGAVRLWDIRHNGRSLRFKFPAPITHAKKLGDQRIVVAGKNNNLHIYDLRSTPIFDAHGMSRPYMTFGTYRNQDFNGFNTSLDVHDNLIAASTSDRHVQLFNENTGHEIPIGLTAGFSNVERSVFRLRFADKETVAEYGTGPKLYVSNGKTVEEWAW